MRGLVMFGLVALVGCTAPVSEEQRLADAIAAQKQAEVLADYERMMSQLPADRSYLWEARNPVSARNTQFHPPEPYPRVTRAAVLMTQYQSAVSRHLRDPESARYTDLRIVQIHDGRDALCGSVNAKNAFGGYVGADRFYAVMNPSGRSFTTVPFFVSDTGPVYYARRCGEPTD